MSDKMSTNGPATNGGNYRSGDDVPTLDTILECLVHSRRRQILYALESREIVTDDAIARRIAALERDIPPSELAREEYEQILVELRQQHLPKLADAHVIEYDRRSHTVRYDDPPKPLEWLLQLTARIETGSGFDPGP